jgi:hypothetical protein
MMDAAPNPTNENAGGQPGESSATSQKHEVNHSWNSTEAQCARALKRMRDGPVTTYELRRKHDIYDPPSRVLQLRKHGHEITTLWQRVRTEAGVVHRVGQYCLIKEAV